VGKCSGLRTARMKQLFGQKSPIHDRQVSVQRSVIESRAQRAVEGERPPAGSRRFWSTEISAGSLRDRVRISSVRGDRATAKVAGGKTPGRSAPTRTEQRSGGVSPRRAPRSAIPNEANGRGSKGMEGRQAERDHRGPPPRIATGLAAWFGPFFLLEVERGSQLDRQTRRAGRRHDQNRSG